MFKFIRMVNDLNGLSSNASFSYECISQRCNIGKDVWVKYLNNISIRTGNDTFTVSGSLGDVPAISFYVKNPDDTYSVYGYHGSLTVSRTTIDNIVHDVLLNIDDIASELKHYLRN